MVNAVQKIKQGKKIDTILQLNDHFTLHNITNFQLRRKGTFEQRPEEDKRASHVHMCGKRILD